VSVPVFVAQEIGHTFIDENVWMPTVTIDVSESPEIADLARVHAVEGIGDVNTHAIRQDDAVVIGVRLTSPVEAMFAVAFSYSLHRDFLYEVADAGTLVFATTSTETAHQERPLWLSVFIDGNDMRQALTLPATGSSQRLWPIMMMLFGGVALIIGSRRRISQT
jgi:LPXTG-motif cell wall-anchored protein